MVVDMVRGRDISRGFSRCIEKPPGLISLVSPLKDTCGVLTETGELILALGYFRFSLSEVMTVPLVSICRIYRNQRGPKRVLFHIRQSEPL